MDWLPAETTTAPVREPMRLDTLRQFLRIDGEDHDQNLLALLAGARSIIESRTGLRLFTQTVKLRTCGFANVMRLPISPVQSITSVKYLDSDGVQQTLSDSVYETVLYGNRNEICLISGQSWPSTFTSPQAVEITAVVGFGDVTDLPPDIQMALFLTVSHLFDNQAAEQLPPVIDTLLANRKRYSFS